MRILSIIGAGGHGAAVADAALQTGQWERIDFYDDHVAVGSQIHGMTVRGTVRDLAEVGFAGAQCSDMFVAIGDNARRLTLARQILEAGATLATVIHPAAVLGSHVALGAGSVIMAGAVLNVAAQIGIGCIVNTRASVDHDCVIGNGVHVGPGVALAGRVRIGDLSWVGIGACVIQERTIGAHVTVGAGSVVIRDVEDGVTVVGNPARNLRS